MIDVNLLSARLAASSLVRSIARLPAGPIAITTALVYPDGDSIEVYLPQDATTEAPEKLTDYGNTTAWLSTAQINPWLSKKRTEFVNAVLRQHDVRHVGGAFERTLGSLDDLPDAVIGLGQACLRASDLLFTRRLVLQTTFAEEIEETLGDVGLPFEANVEIELRAGRVVKVDYLVTGRSKRSALMTLAATSRTQAHGAATDVFSRWSHMHLAGRIEDRVTVFDDRQSVYRDDDMELLQTLSTVVPASNRPMLRDILAA